jgi:predicted nucleotidyltransferase component of viral defense system
VTAASKGLAASVQVRLIQHAKAVGLDPNLVLARYGMERFLYRLSQSPYADRFVLKGALLMLVWLGETIRPTRDADLLGFGELSQESFALVLRDVCAVQVEPDGLQYLISSVGVSAIRAADDYGGLRGTVQARLGKARLRVQIDVGIGDAVVPAPEWLEYPSLLGFPPPRLRVYRPETAIAEKLHAMVKLGMDNSRMRDFFDVHALATQRAFNGHALVASVRATFERRQTPIPGTLPIALTTQFATLSSKVTQWRGFLTKSRVSSAPREFDQVITTIARFLEPVIAAARTGASFNMTWAAGSAWLPDDSGPG